MPELSRFFGIIIRMFPEPGVAHHLPHFHVYYQEHTAVYSIDPVALIAGYLSQRQQRLVEAWGEIHQQELRDDWERLLAGHVISPIKPLE
jgi:hypothetical protein